MVQKATTDASTRRSSWRILNERKKEKKKEKKNRKASITLVGPLRMVIPWLTAITKDGFVQARDRHGPPRLLVF